MRGTFKNIALKALLAVLISSMLVSVVGCSFNDNNTDEYQDDVFSDVNDDSDDDVYIDENESDEEYVEEEEIKLVPFTVSAPMGFAESDDFYISSEEKQAWYESLVKLISNQEKMVVDREFDSIDFKPPRPGEPSIVHSYNMGLYDINFDGVPELVVDAAGSNSSGSSLLYMYDISTGRQIAGLYGGGGTFGVYYDIKNKSFMHVGRYDIRLGASASSHYVTQVAYDAENGVYFSQVLFKSHYSYDTVFLEDENGRPEGVELNIEEVSFEANGKRTGFQNYHYELTDFYQEHSLIPYTNLNLHYIGGDKVSDDDDSDLERAQKIATVLLNDTEQKFIRFTNK